MGKIVGLGAAGAVLLLASCAGGHLVGMKGSARRDCYDQGLQPGTMAFKQCWQAVARADNAEVGQFVAGAAVGAAAVAAARNERSTGVLVEPAPAAVPKRIPGYKTEEGCVYWTPAKRVMKPVNGICPLYGQ